jgi:prepilin-type N-terminal cleavage/methylation domain-containing protein/prepilin-type processing-associated H-X9-DG protein
MPSSPVSTNNRRAAPNCQTFTAICSRSVEHALTGCGEPQAEPIRDAAVAVGRKSGAPRLGFTLVELLVVIAIIGVLVALLLPAIQAAREAARRSSCGNNLKQLGLALQNYHDARKTFPYATILYSTGGNSVQGYYGFRGPTWVVAILPFIEGGNVITLYNKNAFWMDAGANMSFRAANLPFMICPSDSFANVACSGTGTGTSAPSNGPAGPWARGCYGANASVWSGAQNMYSSPATFQSNINAKGVMSANYSLSMKQITDGTSKVIAVAEMRADPDPGCPRGCWAMDLTCSSLYGHGSTNNFTGNVSYPNQDPGPNNPGSAVSGYTTGDWVVNCNTSIPQQLFNLGMGCNGDGYSPLGGPKSQHPSGLQMVFCDGSVHWMDNSIQLGIMGSTNSAITNGYYEMLFLSQDGAFIPPDVYGG